MVKSGLETTSDTPRVSPYRLSAHLSSAFFIYSITLLTALRVMRSNIAYRYPKGYAISTVGLVFSTAATGAFVAGLHAGHLYPTFPHMGSSWIPPDIWDSKLGLANLTENGVTVQAIHRCMVDIHTNIRENPFKRHGRLC
jgi:cytochrome c oxidase assembly protein subunit 15